MVVWHRWSRLLRTRWRHWFKQEKTRSLPNWFRGAVWWPCQRSTETKTNQAPGARFTLHSLRARIGLNLEFFVVCWARKMTCHPSSLKLQACQGKNRASTASHHNISAADEETFCKSLEINPWSEDPMMTRAEHFLGQLTFSAGRFLTLSIWTFPPVPNFEFVASNVLFRSPH